MSVPTDRQSLLAAWEAIGPCQPLPKDAEGILLAYFKHVETVESHGKHMHALAEQNFFDIAAPPSRFVRQPRRAKNTPPSGPDAVGSC